MEKILHYVIYCHFSFERISICSSVYVYMFVCVWMVLLRWQWSTRLTPNRYYNMSYYIHFVFLTFTISMLTTTNHNNSSNNNNDDIDDNPDDHCRNEMVKHAKHHVFIQHTKTILIIHESMNIFISFSVWWFFLPYFFLPSSLSSADG